MGAITKAASRYIAADRERALAYQHISRSDNSWRRDRSTWRRFTNYLGPIDPWKATPEDVAAWCASLAEEGVNPNSIPTLLSTLNLYYDKLGKGFLHGRPGKGLRKDNPVRAEIVKATVRGIRHVHGRPPIRAEPIMLDTLEKMIDVQPYTLRGLRNKALLALCWGGALRGTELRFLDANERGDGDGHIEIGEDGIVVSLKRSKVNVGAYAWERYGIPRRRSAPRYCPTALVEKWLQSSDIGSGPVFPSMSQKNRGKGARLDHVAMYNMVKQAVAQVGLPPERYGVRSLRAGCITWLTLEGVPLPKILIHSGHRHHEMLNRYIRPMSPVAISPLSETRWCR